MPGVEGSRHFCVWAILRVLQWETCNWDINHLVGHFVTIPNKYRLFESDNGLTDMAVWSVRSQKRFSPCEFLALPKD